MLFGKMLKFYPGNITPSCELEGSQYLLYVNIEDIKKPQYFIALFENNTWWIRTPCYVENESFMAEDGNIIKEKIFEKISQRYTVRGWARLFGA